MTAREPLELVMEDMRMVKVTAKMVKAASKVLYDSGELYSETLGDRDPSPFVVREMLTAALLVSDGQSHKPRRLMRYWRQTIPLDQTQFRPLTTSPALGAEQVGADLDRLIEKHEGR